MSEVFDFVELAVAVLETSILASSLQLTISHLRGLGHYAIQYGWIRAYLLQTVLGPAKTVIDRVKTHVVEAGAHSADGASAITRSYAASLNMIGVTGAIVAQIAITAISLNNIEETHWTATAAFVVSLVTGSLAVYFACLIQVKLNSLHGADEVKDWLTTPKARCTWIDAESPEGPAYAAAAGKRKTPVAYIGSIASFNSAVMLILPAYLLNWSVGALLVGIGIYYGLVFTRHLGSLDGSNANLAVLVAYVVSTAYALMAMLGMALGKMMEETPNERKRTVEQVNALNQELGIAINETGDNHRMLLQLEDKAIRMVVGDLLSSPYTPPEIKRQSTASANTHHHDHSQTEYEYHLLRLAEVPQAASDSNRRAQQTDQTRLNTASLVAALEKSSSVLQASTQANESVLQYLRSLQTSNQTE